MTDQIFEQFVPCGEMRSFFSCQRGVALLVVLWVMTILTVIVAQFCFSMRSEVNVTRNFRDSAKAYYHARAGVQYALYYMVNAGALPAEVAEGQENIPWRVNVENPRVAFGDGAFQIHVGNESGRVNINMADANLLEMLFSGVELDEQEVEIIVDSIQDWRDIDSLHRIHGAESDYYERLPEPYSCGNSPFRAVEDLLLVRGVTPEIFKAVRDSITIYPQSAVNTPPAKEKRGKKGVNVIMEQHQVNINAAPDLLLAALPEMTAGAIEDIKTFRQEADFVSLSEVRKVVGDDIYQQIARYISLERGTDYRITATGFVDDSRAKHNLSVVVHVDPEKSLYTYLEWIDSVSK